MGCRVRIARRWHVIFAVMAHGYSDNQVPVASLRIRVIIAQKSKSKGLAPCLQLQRDFSLQRQDQWPG